MEHHNADVWQVAARETAGDDAARFLRELRQLRDGAGLGHAELAARAHYPYDLIQAAEAGPSLPDLPVLSAYVRGCGGTAEEWEERWRRLTSTPSLPVSESRHAGNSAAATAGARIGATTQVVDADPSIIIAALNRVAEGMAVGGPDVDAVPLTVPPRPGYPGDDLPAEVSTAGVSAAHVLLPEVALPEALLPDVSSPDVFAADPVPEPVIVPADFSAFTPAAPVVDSSAAPVNDPLVTSAADSPAGDAPEADDRPKGWDPIRVSAAWPTIGQEDLRPGAGKESGSVTRPAIRQSAWAGGVDAFGEPTDVARPGSRARTLVVAVVLICVVAVVLAIFA